ncbi:T9SS type A sorting domain-containing protein [Robiginitalea marina]|jgi:hypothetical protein|uniref:T9SS type A sorting domain-containing protein n=1 Tax=Robiginitalea marina TaxID=2954105 RepID=A0ABT1AX42_9FLAO|nr:T9SS type A sorting domain-containing protein [Robiginitalea marina]MCO5724566.1 T9SS type A sorting domain-containing protein [Robiginitalea marina]
MKQLFLLLCFMGLLSVSAQEVPSDSLKTRIDFKVHPNPVTDGVVYIESPQPGPKTIHIYDLFGKTVVQRQAATASLSIRLGALAPGVYMVQVSAGGRMATKKLIVR